MGFFSKIFKGIKSIAKSVFKTIKKTASRVWKSVKEVGKGVMKVVNKLGPLGMIALSILMPYAAPLWSAFGAAAGATGGILGTIGTAVYNGVNWVAGTISSITSGISKGIGQIAKGSLKAGLDTASKGFVDAFTGQAGSKAVEVGIQKAVESASTSIIESTVGQLGSDVSEAFDIVKESTKDLGGLGTDAPLSGFETFDKFGNPVTLEPGALLGDQSKIIGDLATTDFSTPSVLDSVDISAAEELFKGPSVGAQKIVQGAKKVTQELFKSFTAPTAQEAQNANVLEYKPNFAFSGVSSSAGGVGSQFAGFLSPTMQRALQASTSRMVKGF